jgi:hypothetical protein
MNVPGFNPDEIDQLCRAQGPDALIHELESYGVRRQGKRRFQCPFEGCRDQGERRPYDASVHGSHPRLSCFRCHKSADLIDLLQLSRGIDVAGAIAHLKGQPAPAPRKPLLQLVLPAVDPEKLSPAEARRLWEGTVTDDAPGRAYLQTRGLEDAVANQLVRFATETHPDRKLRKWATKGYRIALQLLDVVGAPMGLQVRKIHDDQEGPKILTAEGSNVQRGFFGRPDRIEIDPVVCVTEGWADTLAVSLWAGDAPGTTFVGATGTGVLPILADELAKAGVPLDGKVFALFTQNDNKKKGPVNPSRMAFVQLAQRLRQQGAHVALINMPPEYSDVADWRNSAGIGAPWPPPELEKALQQEDQANDELENQPVLGEGLAIPIPKQVTTTLFAQNFTTLCTILDNPLYREPFMGRGELEWCQMRHAILFAGKPLQDADFAAIKLGLETHARATDAKARLKFDLGEIETALNLLAHRKQIHPARDWLRSLRGRWDQRPALAADLGALFGHDDPDSLEGFLLRKWFIAAVARAMAPGCKMENVLVLVGNQEYGKTSFFEILGGDWYTSERVDVGDKDGKLIMRRAWIIEWGELESMRRAKDQEAIKAFLSQRIDHFRPHYGRVLFDAPRACVIGGTTNNDHYLTDPTGNRRFWTVELKRHLDRRWLRENRERLFAEAVDLYFGAQNCEACRPLLPNDRCADHRWWLVPEENGRLAEANAAHEFVHPWAELVRDHLENRAEEEVSAAFVLIEILKKPDHMITEADRRNVGSVMKTLGWSRVRRRVGEGTEWVYRRPRIQLGVDW